MIRGKVARAAFENKQLCAFFGVKGSDSLLVIHNLSRMAVTHKVPENLGGFDTVVFTRPEDTPGPVQGSITLPAYGTLVLDK